MKAPRRRRGQQGAALIALVAALSLLLALAASYLSHAQAFEQRINAAQQQSAAAAEAAEAGLAWFERLIHLGKVNAQCHPDPGGESPRTQALQVSARGVEAQLDGGTSRLLSQCMAAEAVWRCTCGSAGPMADIEPSPAGMQSRMAVYLRPSPRPGVLRVRVVACATTAQSCDMEAADAGGAAARTELEADYAHLAPVQHLPQAPLTTRGDVQGGDMLNLERQTEVGVGPLLQAGGQYQGRSHGSSNSTGQRTAGALVLGDARLRAQALIEPLFGMPMAAVIKQPGMVHLNCPADGDCADSLMQVLALGPRLVHLQGAARILSPVEIGTLEHPVLLLVDGNLSVQAPTQMQGLLVIRGRLDWQASAGSPPVEASGVTQSRLDGAVVVDGDAAFSGPVTLSYAPLLLQRLQHSQGSWVRLSGSWTQWQ